MSAVMILRLVLDLLGMGLLLAALAYYWLGNAFHEVVGTGFFLLLVAHNTFNRWWWSGLLPRPWKVVGRSTAVINLTLLTAMVALLVTSVMISETVFRALGFGGGFTARQIHRLAAYWALAIASIHLGLHWHMVMRAVRNLLRFRRAGRGLTWCLRLAAMALAIQGMRSSTEMTLGSKLVLHPVLDMWDFDESAIGFFLHYGTIVGLYATLGHYAGIWLRRSSVGKAL